MLTVHHLNRSQSERIVWLCEELDIVYKLKVYSRNPDNMMAPAQYKDLHPMGAAPVITDGDVLLAESSAIVDYILNKHAKGRLAVDVNSDEYSNYLYWFHFANGSLHPLMARNMLLARSGLHSDHPLVSFNESRLQQVLRFVDDRLSKSSHLACDEFTAADVMTVFVLSTMCYFYPVNLDNFKNIQTYLRRIGGRSAYQRAMQNGDPDMKPLLA
jgi:glutathione S-transferase